MELPLFMEIIGFLYNTVYREASLPENELDPFSYFDGTQTCDRQTDRQRTGHS